MQPLPPQRSGVAWLALCTLPLLLLEGMACAIGLLASSILERWWMDWLGGSTREGALLPLATIASSRDNGSFLRAAKPSGDHTRGEGRGVDAPSSKTR